jgi:large subunit ribosomal protein L22
MKACLKNYRQAPRKVRLIADRMRGRRVSDVLVDLSVMPQKSAPAMKKLLESAVANARQKDPSLSADMLTVATIMVDQGITYRRYMPRAFGRAAPIKHECSHVILELDII